MAREQDVCERKGSPPFLAHPCLDPFLGAHPNLVFAMLPRIPTPQKMELGEGNFDPGLPLLVPCYFLWVRLGKIDLGCGHRVRCPVGSRAPLLAVGEIRHSPRAPPEGKGLLIKVANDFHLRK